MLKLRIIKMYKRSARKGSRMDIKSVRDYMNMSQKEFSEFWGINVNTLQNWEQGRAKAPDYLNNIFFKYFDLEARYKNLLAAGLK